MSSTPKICAWTDLPPEVWSEICRHLPKPALLRLRLVSSKLSAIGLPWVYKSLRLEARTDSAERFILISKNPKLRRLVREVTVKTWGNHGDDQDPNGPWQISWPLANALPYLRCFTNVTTLHVRFHELLGVSYYAPVAYNIEHSGPFRYRVMETICHCVIGMWTPEIQAKIDETARFHRYFSDAHPLQYADDQEIPLGHVMPLRELTISNLSPYKDYLAEDSGALKKMLSLPSLVNLKLLITSGGRPDRDRARSLLENGMLQTLPETWMFPSIAENLQTLSLVYGEYWGLYPKVDFLQLGESSLPRLKVLALGNYVFGQAWQVDWVASVGQENGGLQELYLVKCPIIVRAWRRRPFDDGDNDESVTETFTGPEPGLGVREYHLRWQNVLSRWAESMNGLRVFCMGEGPEGRDTSKLIHQLAQEEAYSHVMSRRYNDRRHQGFASEICTDKEKRLKYARLNINMFHGHSGWKPALQVKSPGDVSEGDTTIRDEAAYERLMSMVNARALAQGSL
ncbi:F-box domain-containing protein [Fusarium keratoplasticum]|uniref:F-box domain-containing protein n=1 Tax=Fusarium keratoplasticum TaxID=1328300 RepID=A0ACC0QH42_9HYPO|nr:F-box domain-containing protein [Fusarium keratoplasticum]KAI8652294.1 F-box domain-containing protein [Fusarium keratoplasticum]KAI8653035.1 F-box domain-containing protein [Fusarium keratoplasticum]